MRRLKPIKSRQALTRWRIVAAGVAILLLAAACSGGDDAASEPMTSNTTVADRGSSTTTTIARADDRARGGAATDGESTFGDGAIVPVALQAVDIGRDIIFLAQVTVAVDDVAAATREATDAIQGLGGFVAGQRSAGGANPSSVLTFKVFPEDFQLALDRLGSLGEIRSQEITSDDVTERIVDLESRINTASASVDRLRDLLGTAGNFQAIAEIENQLLQRETQLETLRGQLRTLEDAVALATITLTVTARQARPALALAVGAYPGHDDAGQSCPGRTGSLEVDEGGPLTLCFTAENTGDVALVDFQLADATLDLTASGLIVVEGELGERLEPGDRIVLAAEVEATADIRTRTRVSATPVNAEGEPLPSKAAAATDSFFVDAVDPGGIPSFSDGLQGTLDVLSSAGNIAVLLAGITLPLVWLIPLLVLGRRWLRRRQEADAAAA